MQISFLASSSKANCSLVECDGGALIVDAGLPKSTFLARLRETGRPVTPILNALCGILISHHHGDHAGHAGELSGAFHIPIFCTSETAEQGAEKLVKKAEGPLEIITEGENFAVGKFRVVALSTYHTPGAVGFEIMEDSQGTYQNVSIFTDIPEIGERIESHLRYSTVAALECNHSLSMLAACDEYDQELKDRIRMSHMSNENLAAFIGNGFKAPALKTIVLLHLSKLANLPSLAKAQVERALGRPDVKVLVAPTEGVLGPVEA